MLWDGMVDQSEEADVVCGVPELDGDFFGVLIGEVDDWDVHC